MPVLTRLESNPDRRIRIGKVKLKAYFDLKLMNCLGLKGSMKAIEKRLDIDRWQYKVVCMCGCEAWKWICERRITVSFPCGSVKSLDEIKKEFEAQK